MNLTFNDCSKSKKYLVRINTQFYIFIWFSDIMLQRPLLLKKTFLKNECSMYNVQTKSVFLRVKSKKNIFNFNANLILFSWIYISYFIFRKTFYWSTEPRDRDEAPGGSRRCSPDPLCQYKGNVWKCRRLWSALSSPLSANVSSLLWTMESWTSAASGGQPRQKCDFAWKWAHFWRQWQNICHLNDVETFLVWYPAHFSLWWSFSPLLSCDWGPGSRRCLDHCRPGLHCPAASWQMGDSGGKSWHCQETDSSCYVIKMIKS